jgi:hypothetical protein
VPDDADLARRASRYLDPDRVLETQAAVYRPLLTSGPTGDPLSDFLPELDRRVVESYAADDLRMNRLPEVVSQRLEVLEQKIEKRSHRWKKGMLATALALTEHGPGATHARVA